jgi:hypothetical protein
MAKFGGWANVQTVYHYSRRGEELGKQAVEQFYIPE